MAFDTFSLKFDGTDDYVNCGHDASLDCITRTGTYTFAAWFFASDFTAMIKPSLIVKSPSASDRNVLSYQGGKIRFGYWNGASWQGKSGAIVEGKWIHAVGINQGGALSLYLNGVLQTGTDVPYGYILPDLLFGWSGLSGSGEWWKGLIDDVRVYNRALSDSEIALLAAGGEPSATGLVGHWPFEEGSGLYAYDSSGKGNTGTLIGGPIWVLETTPVGQSLIVGQRVPAIGRLNLFIDGENYSECVASTNVTKTIIKWELNKPQYLDFGLINLPASLSVPERDSFVELQTYSYGFFFRGYISSQPEFKLIGYRVKSDNSQEPVFGYHISVTSEEYQLNVLSPRLALLPSLSGRKSGDIIRIITEFLLPGEFTYDVSDGNYQAEFIINEGEVWSDVVGRLAENDRFHYWTEGGKIYYKPLGDVTLGASYDISTDDVVTGWDMSRMDVAPKHSAIKNDIIIIGGDAPKGHGKAHFVGDGFSGDFGLHVPIFGVEGSVIVNDDWKDGDVDSGTWELADPSNAQQLPYPNLQFIGGAGKELTYVRLLRALELSGEFRLIHGEIQFTNASEGYFGCLYNDFLSLADSNMICGFNLAKSAGQTVIRPMLGPGTLVGNPITTEANHTYVLVTKFYINKTYGYRNEYTPLVEGGDSYGGMAYFDRSTITFEVWDYAISGQYSVDPVVNILYTGELSISDFNPFVAYCLLQAVDFHLAVNFTELSRPILAKLRSSTPVLDANGLPVSWNAWQQKSLGFGIDGAIATISSDKVGHTLRYYNEPLSNIPVAGEKLDVSFTVLGKAIARVVDSTSIAAIKAKYGGADDGIRTEILTTISPAPRTDEDALLAAAARLQDALVEQYSATYQIWDKYCSKLLMPGRFLPVNESRFDSSVISLLVTETQHEIFGDVCTLLDKHFFTLSLGTLLNQDVVLARIKQKQQLAADTRIVADVPVIDILNVETTYLNAEIDDWDVSVVDSVTLRITVNSAVGSNCIEVRKWDRGWGQIVSGTDPGLIIRTSAGAAFFDVPRARSLIFYMRFCDGSSPRKYSQHTSFVKIGYPLVPPKVTGCSAYVAASNKLRISFTIPSVDVNFQDITKIVIKDSDSGTVYGIINWDATRLVYVEEEIVYDGLFTTSFNIDICTYNLLGETASNPPQVVIEYSDTVDVITNLQLFERVRERDTDGVRESVIKATWDAVTDPFVTDGGMIEVQWKQAGFASAEVVIKAPQTAASSGSGDAWSNPNNAKVEDDAFATIQLYNPNHTTQSLVLTHLDAGIPSDAIMKGIQADIKCKQVSGNSAVYATEIKLVGVTCKGKYDAYGLSWALTNLFRAYGGETDLWGIVNPVPADFNADGFGLSIHVTCTLDPGSGAVAGVDFGRIIFFYLAPDNGLGLDYLDTPFLVGDSILAVVGPVVGGPTVYVRVRAVNRFGVVGPWIEETIVPTGNAASLTAVLDIPLPTHMAGLLSVRPVAGVVGRFYYATDDGAQGKTYFDTGATWILVGIGHLGDASGNLDNITETTTRGTIHPSYVDASRRPTTLRRASDDMGAGDIFRYQGAGAHNADDLTDGPTSPLTGGRRGYTGLDTSGRLTAGTPNRSTANIEAVVGADSRAKQLDLGTIAAGNLDNVGDGTTYARTTPNQRDGGGRGYSYIQSTGKYLADKYHLSAFRDKVKTNQQGITSSSYWLTVSSFTVVKPEGATQYKGNLVVQKVSAGATWYLQGRIKIGAELSNVIICQNPDTSNQGIVTVTGLASAEAEITVEVQSLCDAATYSGPRDPTIAVSMAGVGADWSAPENVYTSNDLCASTTVAATGISDKLLARAFGFAIPTSATIKGIFAEIERHKGGTAPTGICKDYLVKLSKSAGAEVGDNHAKPDEWPTTDAYVGYGDSSDKWGTTWTPAEVNDPYFGLLLSIYETGGAYAVVGYVDHIRVTIYYEPSTSQVTFERWSYTDQDGSHA